MDVEVELLLLLIVAPMMLIYSLASDPTSYFASCGTGGMTNENLSLASSLGSMIGRVHFQQTYIVTGIHYGMLDDSSILLET